MLPYNVVRNIFFNLAISRIINVILQSDRFLYLYVIFVVLKISIEYIGIRVLLFPEVYVTIFNSVFTIPMLYTFRHFYGKSDLIKIPYFLLWQLAA